MLCWLVLWLGLPAAPKASLFVPEEHALQKAQLLAELAELELSKGHAQQKAQLLAVLAELESPKFLAEEVCAQTKKRTQANTVPCKIVVSVEHKQLSLSEVAKKRYTLKKSTNYQSEFQQVSGSVNVGASVGYGLFSFSASAEATWNNVNHQVSYSHTHVEEYAEDTIKFMPGFLQLIRKVTQSVTIGKSGATASVVTEEFIDSIPVGMVLQPSDMNARSEQYLKEHHADMKLRGMQTAEFAWSRVHQRWLDDQFKVCAGPDEL